MRDDAITLDTNVLEHLLRTEAGGENSNGHIAQLLDRITSQKRTLCFDQGGRLEGEMAHRFHINRNHPEMHNNLQRLRGILIMLPKEKVIVDQGDGLMNCIDGCVRRSGAEESDKVIMYIACKSNTLLISNNRRHITDHSSCLKGCARQHGATNPEFWDSQTAISNL